MAIPVTRQFIEQHTAMQTAFVLLGLFFMIAFAYILVMLSIKLLGVVLLLAGLWMVVYFPWQSEYQKSSFSKTAILIGIVLIVLGAVLLFFR
jgi:hypothetical protein